MRIQKVLTDNGKEFTDRLFASRARQPTGEHEFDQLCASLGIEHRLTKPRTPRTNGMVERFNGRIADVLRSHRFQSGQDLEQTLLRYAALYNHGKNRRLRAFPLTHFLQALAQQTHGVEPPYEIALTSSGTAVNRSASRP